MCTVQDESEALVCRLVAPEPHERLLDLCAAPGGKSTHLAELMDDEGEGWAMERAEPRVASLEATVARLGTHAVHVVLGDGRAYPFPMPFDCALVEGPRDAARAAARAARAALGGRPPRTPGRRAGLQRVLVRARGDHRGG